MGTAASHRPSQATCLSRAILSPTILWTLWRILSMMPWIRKREGILSIILVPSLTFPTSSISQFPLPFPHLLIISSMNGNTNSEFGYDGYDYWFEKIDTPWCHGSFSHSQNERLYRVPSKFFFILPHPIVLILFTDQNLTFLHFSKLIIWYPYPTSLWLLDHFLTCLPSLSSPTMKIDYPTGPCSFFFRSSHSFLSSHLSFLLQIRSFIQHPSRSIFSSLKQNGIEHFLLISLLHIIFPRTFQLF